MIKSEAKFHSKMMKWLEYNKNKYNFPKSFKIETKVVRLGEDRFPHSELSAKEERQLLKSKHKFFLQTHSDIARLGTNCDGDCISGGGIIFIQWTRYGNKEFHCIDIDAFLEYRDKKQLTNIKGCKSMTEEEAKDIAFLTTKHI